MPVAGNTHHALDQDRGDRDDGRQRYPRAPHRDTASTSGSSSVAAAAQRPACSPAENRPPASVCSMLSEGMRKGCRIKVSRNRATTTVRSREASASGTVGRCKRKCDSRLGQIGDLRRGAHCFACSSSMRSRDVIRDLGGQSNGTSARRAASCSACFFVLPMPRAKALPGSPWAGFNRTSTRKRL